MNLFSSEESKHIFYARGSLFMNLFCFKRSFMASLWLLPHNDSRLELLWQRLLVPKARNVYHWSIKENGPLVPKTKYEEVVLHTWYRWVWVLHLLPHALAEAEVAHGVWLRPFPPLWSEVHSSGWRARQRVSKIRPCDPRMSEALKKET